MTYRPPAPRFTVAPRHTNRKITAREYKLFLNPERFSTFDRLNHDWVRLVTTEACRQGMRFEVDDSLPVYRRKWHVDTADRRMLDSMMTLSVGEERVQDGRYHVSLKGVHQDRYIAAMSSVSARGRATNEFVEQISPPGSRFVSSSEIRRHRSPRLHYLEDVIKHFPATERYLAPYRKQGMMIVDGLVRSELTYSIGCARFEEVPPLVFKLAASYLGTWRDGRRIDDELEMHAPDIVEFSFRYQSLSGTSELERYPQTNIVAGCGLFDALSARKSWLDPFALSGLEYSDS